MVIKTQEEMLISLAGCVQGQAEEAGFDTVEAQKLISDLYCEIAALKEIINDLKQDLKWSEYNVRALEGKNEDLSCRVSELLPASSNPCT